MSTTLYNSGALVITQFFGGVRRGICVQLTTGFKYVELDKKQVKETVKVLRNWLKRREVEENE